MLNSLIVPVIMGCALVGTIALLFLAGSARWSLVYLIRYRLLKREVKIHITKCPKKETLLQFSLQSLHYV